MLKKRAKMGTLMFLSLNRETNGKKEGSRPRIVMHVRVSIHDARPGSCKSLSSFTPCPSARDSVGNNHVTFGNTNTHTDAK